MKKQKQFRTIGILGGMGPEASIDLYQRIIKLSQEKYNAIQDTDYPPIIINSIGLDGFDETGITDLEKVKNQLINEALILEKAGADFIVMPCNTTHVFHEEIQGKLKIPFLNLVEKTANRVSEKFVGILSSESTKTFGLYKNPIIRSGKRVLETTDQEQSKINQAVASAMSGKDIDMQKKVISSILNRMISDGAKSIILGCTEIPLIIKQQDTPHLIYDTSQILAEETLSFSRL